MGFSSKNFLEWCGSVCCLGFYVGVTLVSLRCYFGVTLVTLWRYFCVTLVSLWRYICVTLVLQICGYPL